MKINNHRLTDKNIAQLPCPKNDKPFEKGYPDSIIFHYTAGQSGMSSARFMAQDETPQSAHLVIDRSSEIIQLVRFNFESWHAGRSEFDGREGYNSYSIGVELDNPGYLSGHGNYCKAWFGKIYTMDQVIKATHKNEKKSRYWAKYTDQQIEQCYTLISVLIEKYPSIWQILGHDEIAPGRKQDPGPAFPIDEIRAHFNINNYEKA